MFGLEQIAAVNTVIAFLKNVLGLKGIAAKAAAGSKEDGGGLFGLGRLAGRRPPPAGVTLAELQRALIEAPNDFKRREIWQHYLGKSFVVAGEITQADASTAAPSVTLRHDQMLISVWFERHQAPPELTQVTDAGWRIEVDAELNPTLGSDGYDFFFWRPTRVVFAPPWETPKS